MFGKIDASLIAAVCRPVSSSLLLERLARWWRPPASGETGLPLKEFLY